MTASPPVKTLNAIRKFNRFELKYLISYDTAQRLQEDLKKYVLPDAYAKTPNGLYTLSSLYYDTDDYRFYWEKVDGIKYRRKLRIRQYETDKPLEDDSLVYVEIKQRVDRVTQKRRVPMKYKDALNLCNNLIIPEHEKVDEATLFELYEMLKTNNLRPSCITSYMRNAYFGTDYDSWLRITFDSNIRYRTKNLDLADKKIWEFMISPNMVIMEVKANERVPYWLTEIVSDYNFRLIRVSKYCQWLEASSELPRTVFYLGEDALNK